jgi:hypothetical protein
MTHTLVVLSGLACVLTMACAEQGVAPGGAASTASTSPDAPSAAAPVPSQIPPAVDGWREYPLRDGVLSIQPAAWRTDTIEIAVPAGEGLEYKLTMKQGEGLVYNISYGTLAEPGKLLSEFHGHTKQVDGVGDLMFYARTGGTPQSGVFTAPWDGIHGWYLKNDTPTDVVAKVELAGFYALEVK